MPRGTFAAENVVAVLPVENAVRLLRPGEEPASTTYAVAGQPPVGACQLNVSAPPLTDETRSLGGLGGPLHVPLPTVITISFDGEVNPLAARARTRMK